MLLNNQFKLINFVVNPTITLPHWKLVPPPPPWFLSKWGGDMSPHVKICMGSPGMLYLNIPVTKFCELSYGLLYKYSIPTTFVKTPLPTTFVDLNSMIYKHHSHKPCGNGYQTAVPTKLVGTLYFD